MKLVTGIEAIQSGRPFRYVPEGMDYSPLEWISPKQASDHRIETYLLKRWEIKPEPREFAIFVPIYKGIEHASVGEYVDGQATALRFGCFEPCTTIRVREVLDE
jgi:hypothetical protein